MLRTRIVVVAIAWLGLVGCESSGEQDPDENPTTSAASGAATMSGTGSGATTGSMAGSCSDYDLAVCDGSLTANGMACAYVEVRAVDPETCATGEAIGFCVEAGGDPGCGVTPGCDGEAGYVSLPDGSIAPFVSCGGPQIPGSSACTPVDGGFDPPECGCVCTGDSGSTGGSGSTSGSGGTGGSGSAGTGGSSGTGT